MKSALIGFTLTLFLIAGMMPANAARSDRHAAGLYIAEYGKICYAVTIREIPSKSTLRFRRMGMIEVPCKGTGTLPRISGTWREGIEANTGTCYLELEIPLLARGTHKQILMAQTNRVCP